MKFTCEKAVLFSAVSVASRTVAAKNTLSALEGIYVKAGTQLLLTGYNLETGITVRTAAQILRTGECILPARLFLDIVRKLPDEMVSVTVNENYKATIRGGISTFTIMAGSAEDYPELPDMESEKSVQIPQSKLREMISGTIFSVSDNYARPIHTGCLFEVADESITMVAVDGYRLARRTYHTAEPTGQTIKFVVPASALREVGKILADADEPVTFTFGRKHILFEIGDATLVCRTLEGEFLDWRRVLPTGNPIRLVANVSALSASIERVSLVISEKIKSPVRCTFSGDRADFRVATTIGTAHDRCDVAGNGNDLEIGFNCRYILEALRAVPTQEVTLELKSDVSPVVFTPCDDKYDFAYMVLPVRLKAEK